MADLAIEAGLLADDTLLNAAAKIFTYLWDTAWKHAPATSGGDADALHDMRVAIRRLRSALQNFEGPKNAPLLSARLRRELVEERADIRKMGDVLGRVRDYDVLTDYINEYATKRLKKPIADSAGLAQFERFLQTERAQAFAPMVKKINRAQEAGKLRERFARYALGLPAAAPSLPLSMTLREAARGILEQRVAEVLSHAASLTDARDALGHHELRKAMKRLRYFLEFFAPCFDKPVKPHIKTLTKLQDLLGEMNDRDVLRQNIEHAFPMREAQLSDAAAPDSSTQESHLPPDIAAFLRYGDARAQRLLTQVRALWNEQQERDWPASLLKNLPNGAHETTTGATVAEDAREPDAALHSP